ncbi:MAG: abortive infection family protein [Candidatus Zixiibacteriota bacterium]
MTISTLTRRNLFDAIRLNKISWAGRLEEIEFLARIFDLELMESSDHRFRNAKGDIIQHRIANDDWDNDWVYSDSRFQLMEGPDEILLSFLCEMIHPLVRPNQEEVEKTLTLMNAHLNNDGWEIIEATRISNLPVFTARQLIEGADYHIEDAEKVAHELEASYISQQIIRIRASIDTDPELAIGTGKEFVETVCKSILEERGIKVEKSDDFPELVKKTFKVLKLVPDDIPDKTKAVDTIRRLLSNLGTVSLGLAELRNPYGSGHGKHAKHSGLQPRHARLAVGAAITLATFLFETHKDRK